MKELLLIAAAAGMALASCKKDEDPDAPVSCPATETPSDYFPAYTGSVWNYRDQNNNPVTYSITDELNASCWPALEQLPATVIGKNFQSYVSLGGIGSDYYSTIYSLDVGDESHCYVSFATMHKIESLGGGLPPYVRVATDTSSTLTIPGFPTFDDIVIMKETNANAGGHHYLEYFAKNVGLVRRDSINDSNPGNPVTILLLESYDLGN